MTQLLRLIDKCFSGINREKIPTTAVSTIFAIALDKPLLRYRKCGPTLLQKLARDLNAFISRGGELLHVTNSAFPALAPNVAPPARSEKEERGARVPFSLSASIRRVGQLSRRGEGEKREAEARDEHDRPVPNNEGSDTIMDQRPSAARRIVSRPGSLFSPSLRTLLSSLRARIAITHRVIGMSELTSRTLRARAIDARAVSMRSHFPSLTRRARFYVPRIALFYSTPLSRVRSRIHVARLWAVSDGRAPASP